MESVTSLEALSITSAPLSTDVDWPLSSVVVGMLVTMDGALLLLLLLVLLVNGLKIVS